MSRRKEREVEEKGSKKVVKEGTGGHLTADERRGWRGGRSGWGREEERRGEGKRKREKVGRRGRKEGGGRVRAESEDSSAKQAADESSNLGEKNKICP